MVDQPYFLTLVDEWYSNRLRKAFTPETENELYALFLLKFGSADTCGCHVDSRAHIVDAYKKKSLKFFSYNYKKHSFTINNPKILSIPEINPEFGRDLTTLIETGGKFNVFADLVGSATKDNLDDLSKEVVDKLFLKAYRTPRSFTRLYLKYCERTINLLDLLGDDTNHFVQRDPEYLDNLKITHEVDKTLVPYVHQITFADLN